MPTPLTHQLVLPALIALGLTTEPTQANSDIESQRANAKALIPINSGTSNQTTHGVAYFPDGKHYLIAAYAEVSIFNTKSAALVAKETIEPVFAGNSPSDPSSPLGPYLVYTGIVDHNNYYYAAEDPRTRPYEIRVNIQQIDPPKRLHGHRTDSFKSTNSLRVNHTYINYPGNLINCHTAQGYPVRTFSRPGSDHAMTDSGKIFSRSYPSDWAMLYAPLSDSNIQWKLGIPPGKAVLTSGSRHVVIQSSDGVCRVWPLPELKPVQRCGHAPWFAGDGNVELVTDPAGDHFAASWRKRV